MADEPPLVRHFIACREIVKDPATKAVSLMGLLPDIVPLAGEHYPLKRELAFFALLASGRGKHTFALEWLRFEDGEEKRVKTTPPQERDLGQDPVKVQSLQMRVKVEFDKPGSYTFCLLCDKMVIAEEKILLKEER